LKLNSILVFLLVLLVGSNVVAAVNDAVVVDNQSQGNGANSMTWPLLPGESLNDVARLFYPKNKAMQRKFVFKTLRLNVAVRPNLQPSERFETPVSLIIPTLKSLSVRTHPIKLGRKKSDSQKLKMSYGIEQIPAKLMQDYEILLSKNAFLKEELARLNEKLIFLQTKLNELKLALDQTLNLPAKKVFKKLDHPEIDKPLVATAEKPVTNSLFGNLSSDLIKMLLALFLLAGLGAYLLKKYRQNRAAKMGFVATSVQTTMPDMGGHWQNTLVKTEYETVQATRLAKAAKETESRLEATLEEARLLMGINRTSDAIVHLKLTIESQPKASIYHWLYLLEIFRKLNLQQDFEHYATGLHETFNVIAPAWQDTEIAMVVAQSLEEFPHIMEKLYSTWPDDAAAVYLRSLITDNRGGERTGFGKAVLSEILLLIALLDTRKEIS